MSSARTLKSFKFDSGMKDSLNAARQVTNEDATGVIRSALFYYSHLVKRDVMNRYHSVHARKAGMDIMLSTRLADWDKYIYEMLLSGIKAGLYVEDDKENAKNIAIEMLNGLKDKIDRLINETRNM